jgi:hypothetical protein
MHTLERGRDQSRVKKNRGIIMILGFRKMYVHPAFISTRSYAMRDG